MKTKAEIITAVQKAVNEDMDISIWAIRKSDGYEGLVCMVLGNSDTVENYINEIEKEANRLVVISKWEIAGFEIESE